MSACQRSRAQVGQPQASKDNLRPPRPFDWRIIASMEAPTTPRHEPGDEAEASAVRTGIHATGPAEPPAGTIPITGRLGAIIVAAMCRRLIELKQEKAA